MHHVTDTGILIWTYACDCDCTVLRSIIVGRTVQKELFKHLYLSHAFNPDAPS